MLYIILAYSAYLFDIILTDHLVPRLEVVILSRRWRAIGMAVHLPRIAWAALHLQSLFKSIPLGRSWKCWLWFGIPSSIPVVIIVFSFIWLLPDPPFLVSKNSKNRLLAVWFCIMSLTHLNPAKAAFPSWKRICPWSVTWSKVFSY